MRPDYKTAVTVAYVLGVFIQILDATVVNVALAAIGDDFGVPANEVEWVVLGYLLTLTIGIPAAAWVAERFGSKRAFVASLIGFVAASVLCGLAPSLHWLVAARVLQGLPAGLITPVGAAILYRAFPQNERAKAAAAVVGVAVVAPSIGPVLGGILVDQLSWHWIFFINIPFGLAAIAVAIAWLRPEPREAAPPFDRVGFVLAGTALASLLYSLSIGPRSGWLSALTVSTAALGVVSAVALVRYETRHDNPMIDFRLLAERHFRRINLIGIWLYGGFIGFIYVLPLYIQQYRGLSATAAGTTQFPQALGVFVVSNLVARRAYERFGARVLLVAGSVATAIATALFVFVDDTTSLWLLRALLFGRGLAIGFVFVTIQTIAYATTSHADTGRAVSIFTTQRQLANALGVALMATVLTTALNLDLSLDAYRIAFAASAAMFIPAIAWALQVREADVANTRVQSTAAAAE